MKIRSTAALIAIDNAGIPTGIADRHLGRIAVNLRANINFRAGMARMNDRLNPDAD